MKNLPRPDPRADTAEYRDFWLPRFQEAAQGADRMGVEEQRPDEGSASSAGLHVRGSLVNHAVKTGTLHRLEARLTMPSGTSHPYEWRLFFSYVPGTLNVQPASNAIAIPR
jgi:hypothetical protein